MLNPSFGGRKRGELKQIVSVLFLLLIFLLPHITSSTPSYYSTSDSMSNSIPDENLSETLAQIFYPNYEYRGIHKKKSCIRRGGSCDYRGGECCYSSSCRCNLLGSNCRCQRQGLFQRWGYVRR